MQLGMIGLGRMGANMVRRLMRDGHECVVFDVDEKAVSRLESEGASGAGSLAELVERLEPIFVSLAPGVDSAPRTEGRVGEPTAAEQGYLHCGPSGAGHFVKMVHNGIEYGIMAAYAEGLNVLHKADVGMTEAAVS